VYILNKYIYRLYAALFVFFLVSGVIFSLDLLFYQGGTNVESTLVLSFSPGVYEFYFPSMIAASGDDFVLLDSLVEECSLFDYVFINGSKFVRVGGGDYPIYTLTTSYVADYEESVDPFIVVNFSTYLIASHGDYSLPWFIIPVFVNSSGNVTFRFEWYTKVSKVCSGRFFGKHISSTIIYGGVTNGSVLVNGYNLVNVTTYIVIIEGLCAYNEYIAVTLTFLLAIVMGVVLFTGRKK